VQIALAEQALGDGILAEKDLSEALSHDDPWIAALDDIVRNSGNCLSISCVMRWQPREYGDKEKVR
jgi:hypothetical protein